MVHSTLLLNTVTQVTQPSSEWITIPIRPILRIGVEDVTASKSSTDGELEIGWDCPALANSSEGPEEILELTSGILIS